MQETALLLNKDETKEITKEKSEVKMKGKETKKQYPHKDK